MTIHQNAARPLTDAAYRRLHEELDHLRQEQEPACRRRLLELRGALGEEVDRSLALQQLTRLQQRIRDIEAILATEPDEPPPRQPGLITIGSRVAVRDARGRLQHFVLVSPLEVSVMRGGVSTASPVGAALLGRRVGDAVRIDVPAGVRVLTVLSVE
ncbi:MAG: GreA/GreB family elongation factor [Dehalococcoidia bacterium]